MTATVVTTTFNEKIAFPNSSWRIHANGNLEVFSEKDVVALFQKDSWLFVRKVETPNG